MMSAVRIRLQMNSGVSITYQRLLVLRLHRFDDFAHGEGEGGRAAKTKAGSPPLQSGYLLERHRCL